MQVWIYVILVATLGLTADTMAQKSSAVIDSTQTECIKTNNKKPGWECCQYWPHDKPAFDKCCTEAGVCPICPWTDNKHVCFYKGKWWNLGDIMEVNLDKCYQIECQWKKPAFFPTPVIVHVSKTCQCCIHNGTLYEEGDTVVTDPPCYAMECRNGTWVKTISDENRPCPAGTWCFQKQYCVYTWPCVHTWNEAKKLCKLVGGQMILPPANKDVETIMKKVEGRGGVWLGEASGEGQCSGILNGDDTISNNISCADTASLLKPLCFVPKVPCNQKTCIIGNQIYEHGDVISEEECHRVVCDNGYPSFERQCCCMYDYIPGVGWIHEHWPAGEAIFPAPNVVCKCYDDFTYVCQVC